jgi:hypothetical protein
VIEQPLVVPAEPVTPRMRTDLQIIDLRFVDRGDRNKQTGPRFRVSVRNLNSQRATGAVNIATIGAIDLEDETLGKSVAHATVESIGPLEVAQIDIDLSRDVLQLAKGVNGEPIPFAELAVILDPEEQYDDVRPDNNVLVQSIDQIPHVDLKLLSLSHEKLKPNEELVVLGEGFQFEPGIVALVINDTPHKLSLTRWSPRRIEVQVPNFLLIAPVEAELIVLRPDDSTTEPKLVKLTPGE